MNRQGAIAAGLVLLNLMALLPAAAATNDPPSGGGTVSGNWTVTDSRTYTNVYILLDRGNLVIRSGGVLTLDHVTLQLRMDSNGQFFIEVQSGGTLVIKNGCSLSSTNADRHYYFRIRSGAFATLGNSTFRDVGYTYDGSPVENNGIYVASENVTVDACTITDSVYGIYLDRVSPGVSNCVFRNIASYGIYVHGSSPVLSGNNCANGYIGIYCSQGAAVITRCSFSTNYYGVYVYYSTRTRVDNSTFKDHYYDGVLATYFSTPEVRDCTFTNNGQWDWWYGAGIRYNEFSGGRCYRNTFTSAGYGNGVACDDSASPVIDNCDFDTTYRPGVFADYHSKPLITNSTLSSVNDAAVISTGYSETEVGKCVLNSDWGYGVSVYGYGIMRMANCTVRAQNSYGLVLDSSGSLSVRDTEINARYYGAYCSRSTLEMARCNLTSTENSGLLVLYASRAYIEKSTITADDVGIYVYGSGAYASVRSGTTIGARNSIGALVVDGRLDLDGTSVYSTRSYGMYSSSDAIVNCANSTTITSLATSYIYLDTGGHNFYNLTDTAYDKSKVVFTEPTSVLNVSWTVNIRVLWQNGAPAVNASVNVTTVQGQRMLEGRTNQKGEYNCLVQEYTRTQMNWVNFTPQEFSAFKNGIKKTEKKRIDSPHQIVPLTLVDPDPPVLTILSPASGIATNSSRVDVLGTAEDFASGLADVRYSVDGGSWLPVNGLNEWNFSLDLRDGAHLIKVRAYDVAGTTQEAGVSIMVDTAISLDLQQPAEGAALNSSAVNFSGTAEPFANVSAGGIGVEADSEGAFELVLGLEDGAHTIDVAARDAAGNRMVVTRHFTVDTVAPRLVLTSPSYSLTREPMALFRGETEPGARLGIAGNPYFPEANGSFAITVLLREGNNSIEVRAVDAAGNANTTTVSVRLDTVPPNLRLTSPPDDLVTNSPELNFSGESDGILVQAGGANSTVEAGRFSGVVHLAEGMNYLEFIAMDAAGNVLPLSRKVTLDTRPPFLQLVIPSPGFITNNAALTVTGVTEPGAVVTVNGAAAANANGSLSLAVRLVEGNNSIVVRAVDPAGNAAYLNRTVVLDQVPPLLVITSPSGGFRTSDSRITVRGQTDPGSTVMVNGVNAQMDGAGGFAAEISLSDGENSIVATAVDPAGNPTTVLTKVVRTGPLSLMESGTPLILLGLLIGIAVGAAVGMYLGQRRKPKMVVLAPEEPLPGQYDVPEESASPPAAPARGVEAGRPYATPQYARRDEGYPTPGREEDAAAYRPEPRSGPPPEPPLPSVPVAETVPPAELVPPLEPSSEEERLWEEEERRPPAKGADHLDKSLEDIMKRLKT